MQDPFFQVYLVVSWMVAALAVMAFHLVSRNSGLKSRIHPWLLASLDGLFVLVAGLADGSWLVALLAAVLAIPAWFLQMKIIRFCGTCGLTVFYATSFMKPNFCPQCGSRLGG